jgi:heme-degrading monooxygenase HmoA
MFARVVTVQISLDKTDEATSIYRDSVVPAAGQQPGFKGLLLLLCKEEQGKALSITLWDSEAAMTASESSGFLNQQLAKFGSSMTARPTTEHFEVAVQA